jgi:hypothetical protein
MIVKADKLANELVNELADELAENSANFFFEKQIPKFTRSPVVIKQDRAERAKAFKVEAIQRAHFSLNDNKSKTTKDLLDLFEAKKKKFSNFFLKKSLLLDLLVKTEK